MGSATGLFAQWEKSVGFGDSKVMFDRLDERRFCESVDWEGKKCGFLGVGPKNAEESMKSRGKCLSFSHILK